MQLVRVEQSLLGRLDLMIAPGDLVLSAPGKQGGGRCWNARGSGSAPYVHPTRADVTKAARGGGPQVSGNKGDNLEPASGLEPLTC